MTANLVAILAGLTAGLAFLIVGGVLSGRRTADRHANARMARMIARTESAPAGTVNKWGDN